MKRPTRDDVRDFVSGNLSEEDTQDFYAKLAEDPDLQRRVKAMRLVRDRFEDTWETFVDTIATRANSSEQGKGIVATTRVLFDATRGLVTAAGISLHDTVKNSFEISFAPMVGTASPELGFALDHVRKASQAIAANKDVEARAELELAANVAPSVVEQARLLLAYNGSNIGEIRVDAVRGTVLVSLEPRIVRSQLVNPVAILRSVDAETAVEQIIAFEMRDNTWVAEFSEIPDGRFDISLAESDSEE